MCLFVYLLGRNADLSPLHILIVFVIVELWAIFIHSEYQSFIKYMLSKYFPSF